MFPIFITDKDYRENDASAMSVSRGSRAFLTQFDENSRANNNRQVGVDNRGSLFDRRTILSISLKWIGMHRFHSLQCVDCMQLLNIYYQFMAFAVSEIYVLLICKKLSHNIVNETSGNLTTIDFFYPIFWLSLSLAISVTCDITWRLKSAIIELRPSPIPHLAVSYLKSKWWSSYRDKNAGRGFGLNPEVEVRSIPRHSGN